MGDNAKVFPILAIEEPEAHLHPAMQYKFLKFLDNNLHEQKQARQAFVTTHSTQITSAVNLDSIICLYEDFEGHQRISYPGRALGSQEDIGSKAYVGRFLDATKSSMLFADRVIFVEGIAEQLLLPCLAAYLGSEEVLLDAHTAIVSVDSTAFQHFLKLFAYRDDEQNYCLRRKVVCITDADPSQKEIHEEDNHRKAWKACYPFQLDAEPEKYVYQPLAGHARHLRDFAANFPHIKIATPAQGIGKTLEYELAYHNPSCSLLLTDSLPTRGKNNKQLLVDMMAKFDQMATFDELLEVSNHEDIKEWLKKCKWDEERKKAALVAASYHRAVEGIKGEHAFQLERRLRENLLLVPAQRSPFNIPNYLAESIGFITA